MSTTQRIPFHVEINQIIELLARQIYQSPLALLRENCQNAYDAILMRRHLGQPFEPQIDILLTPTQVKIVDNGIGMTRLDLENYYWKAGSSGKNNPEARAAGVVGTFGIGAMANFGIASALTVISESAIDGQRTRCYAERETLSATEDCIDMINEPSTGHAGTTVIAEVAQDTPVNVDEASTYINEFIRYLDIVVTINGKPVSKDSFENSVIKPTAGWTDYIPSARLGSQLVADADLAIANTGEVWLGLMNIHYGDKPIDGQIILWQGMHQIRTYRSRFALAKVSVSSSYNFGGVANLAVLEPTAGREALTTSSLQLLQTIVTESDRYVSEKIATTPLSNSNTCFMDWTSRHGRHELCSKLRIRLEPDNRQIALEEVSRRGKTKPFNYFEGSDPAIIDQYATDEEPLIIVSSSQPRRRCELSYLSSYCNVRRIVDAPTVLSRKAESELTLEESAFALRLMSILQTDYFVDGRVHFGKISHGLPVYVDISSKPIQVVLDSEGASVAMMLRLYQEDPTLLTGMAKDFIRNVIFPKISNLVPSSTRQGAEAFLRAIRQPRDIFEYEKSDLGSLSEIWEKYIMGDLSMTDAAKQSASIVRTTIQSFDISSTQRVSSIIPDVLESEKVLEQLKVPDEPIDETDAMPAIARLEKESTAKLLIINEDETPLKGYRCFVAITDRARRDRGEFFLQPHRTQIIWGGQKALYIFQHHSGQFGLYYELQSTELLSDMAGGRAFPTCTIILKNQVYIPIPNELRERFIPQGVERKRFEIRFELLYPELGEAIE